MKRYFIPAIPVVLAALGGAMMVYSGYDDAPGGTLLGLALIGIALYLSMKVSGRS